MQDIEILVTGLTAIILFVFGLEHFSKEIEKITGERFRKLIRINIWIKHWNNF
jgi:phosphate:Na+ symporter